MEIEYTYAGETIDCNSNQLKRLKNISDLENISDLLASSLRRAGGAGSLHSGKKTMKESGSRLSSSSRSKWVTTASISSSQNGGLASKLPQWGWKYQYDHHHHHQYHHQYHHHHHHPHLEVQDGSPGAEVGVDVREGGAVLAEVTVEGRGETFKRHSELSGNIKILEILEIFSLKKLKYFLTC